jgi:hypothetical protein
MGEGGVVGGGGGGGGGAPKPPPGEFLGPFYPPPPPSTFFPKLIGLPHPIFSRERSKQKLAKRVNSRIKICASTFETCRLSDLCNYLIFFIIIGHMGNLIQILLDIAILTVFFQFCSKKHIFFIF